MKYLLMIVLLFSFSQTRAEQPQGFYTGNKLLELCEAAIDRDTAQDIADGSACIGFIMGVADAQEVFIGWNRMERMWCLPEHVTGAQVLRVVTKDLQENPQDLHKTASSMVANALFSAFPCE